MLHGRDLLHNCEALLASKFTPDAQDHAEHKDIALIDRRLWNALTHESNKSWLCVCIEPVLAVRRPQRNALRKLVCWAELNEEIEHLAVPATWPDTYKNIFGEVNSMLQVAIHEPLPLQEVFLTAFSAYAFEVANASMSTLETCFSRGDKILRYGTIYDFDPRSLELSVVSQPQSLSYRLEMSIPILQGYAKPGVTNFVITLGGAVESSLRFSENLPKDLDSFEINEDFLRSSIPRLLALPPVEEHELSLDSNTSSGHFVLRPWSGCFGDIKSDATFYVCTTDIAGLGLLHGDWVMARSFDGTRQRLVRIEADDQLVGRAGIIVGSPILVHNLCSQVEKVHPNASCRIVLQPIRFGGSEPALPFAESITVARIAAPLTINKAYQHTFLESLRRYFGFCTRIVQHGDIIGIPLDTDEEHIIEQLNEKTVGANGHYRGLRSNEMAFFRITVIDLKVTSANTAESLEKFCPQCKTGGLGCRIDPASTRVMQKGVENCAVPCLVKTSGCCNDSYPTLTLPSAASSTDGVYSKLLKLVQAALTRNAMNYNLNLSILLEGARGIGKFSITKKVAEQVGIHLMELNCFEIMDESYVKTDVIIKYRFEQANLCAPCLLVLRHVEAFANPIEDTEVGTESKWSTILKECFQQAEENWVINRQPVIVVGTTSELGQVPSSVLSSFKHKYNCKAPSEQGRWEILKDLLADVVILPDVSLVDLAAQTAALVPSDLNNFVKLAKLSSLERCMSTSVLGSSVAAGIPLMSLDFERALKKSMMLYTENIGAPKIPKVSWNDIGGLATVKADILDTVRLPLEHPELFADGLKKRSGLLLYGPPGTGKTLVAKAVATSFSMNFLSVKGPELLNMYIGESEANVRKIFQRARDASPCVIFFDELDSIAPKRGIHGDSGGVMDRIVSQILAELDGVASTDGNVFVLGATNRPDLLDPALLRPGRFDKMLYLGISDTPEAQVHILQALTRKFRLDPAISLYRLAEKCSLNYTGADFYALCSDALLGAMSRVANEINETVEELNRRDVQCHPVTVQYYLAEMAKQEELSVVVKEADFDLALRNLIPSVSQLEMERYTEMKTRFNT